MTARDNLATSSSAPPAAPKNHPANPPPNKNEQTLLLHPMRAEFPLFVGDRIQFACLILELPFIGSLIYSLHLSLYILSPFKKSHHPNYRTHPTSPNKSTSTVITPPERTSDIIIGSSRHVTVLSAITGSGGGRRSSILSEEDIENLLDGLRIDAN